MIQRRTAPAARSVNHDQSTMFSQPCSVNHELCGWSGSCVPGFAGLLRGQLVSQDENIGRRFYAKPNFVTRYADHRDHNRVSELDSFSLFSR
jgi:hypothetical protein